MTNTTESHIADLDGATKRIALASASPARRALLQGVGVELEVVAADIDEGEIRERLLALGTPAGEIASALAREKAEEVAGRLDKSLTIIAADQILLFEGDIFEKPNDREAARETLRLLRGKTHELISAVTAYRAGREIWSCRESAHLTMRDFRMNFWKTICGRMRVSSPASALIA